VQILKHGLSFVLDAESRNSRSNTASGSGYRIPRRQQTAGTSIWDLSLAVWPIEDRPAAMKDPNVVNSMTLQSLFSFKEHFEILQKKEGKGDSTFGSDHKLPARTFSEQDDDAADLLHPMRFERGPVVELDEYWADMPKKRSPTFRHLPLEHAGLANSVNECVIVRAHDRTLPLRLRMFSKGNQAKKGFLSKEGEGKEPAESWEYPK